MANVKVDYSSEQSKVEVREPPRKRQYLWKRYSHKNRYTVYLVNIALILIFIQIILIACFFTYHFITFPKHIAAVKRFSDRYNMTIPKHSVYTARQFYVTFMYLTAPFCRFTSNLISYIASVDIPYFSKTVAYLFYRIYNIDLTDTQKPSIVEYPTLIDLFIREPKNITIDREQNGFVSPCEGRIVSLGILNDLKLPELKVKGKNCNADTLLGIAQAELTPSKGFHTFYIVIYLEPRNIHRFYSPVNFSLTSVTQINGFSLKLLSRQYGTNLDKVLCLNHRVNLQGTSHWGKVNYLLVGAINVGSIFLKKFNKVYENKYRFLDDDKKEVSTIFTIGEEMGYFILGSTIVLFFDAPVEYEFSVANNQEIKIFDILLKKKSGGTDRITF